MHRLHALAYLLNLLLLLINLRSEFAIFLGDHLFELVLPLPFLISIFCCLLVLHRFNVLHYTVIYFDLSILERLLEVALTDCIIEFFPENFNALLQHISFVLECFFSEELLDMFEKKLNFFCNIVVVIVADRALRKGIRVKKLVYFRLLLQFVLCKLVPELLYLIFV